MPRKGYSNATFSQNALEALNYLVGESRFGTREEYLRNILPSLAESPQQEATVIAYLSGEYEDPEPEVDEL